MVDKFILQLELQLADQNVHIQFDGDAREWLGERGYDKLYGARPMARLIQEKVKQPLAEELLFGKLAAWRRGACQREGRQARLRADPGPAQGEAEAQAKKPAAKKPETPSPPTRTPRTRTAKTSPKDWADRMARPRLEP